MKQTAFLVIKSLVFVYFCILRVTGHSVNGFTLGVRDSIMIAHSFKGEEFGPAQNMHGGLLVTFPLPVICKFNIYFRLFRFFWIKDRVENGEVTISYLPTADMVADVLTKHMNFSNFTSLASKLLGEIIYNYWQSFILFG
jgi:hypothetical protein